MHVNYTTLIAAARKARLRAYAPYSSFRVGAALLTSSGRIITGSNIENSSYSLTICAERVALFKAISERQTRFRAIAIAGEDGNRLSPCGACRQVMHELAGNIDVILCGRTGKPLIMKLNALLPLPFTGESLKH